MNSLRDMISKLLWLCGMTVVLNVQTAWSYKKSA